MFCNQITEIKGLDNLTKLKKTYLPKKLCLTNKICNYDDYMNYIKNNNLQKTNKRTFSDNEENESKELMIDTEVVEQPLYKQQHLSNDEKYNVIIDMIY